MEELLKILITGGALDEASKVSGGEVVGGISEQGVKVSESVMGMGDVYRVGEYTIALPAGVPIGISKRHPTDTHNDEVGQSLAMTRLIKDMKDKGLI